jgi:cobalt-zinc-cadmium resistance protein CzcA
MTIQQYRHYESLIKFYESGGLNNARTMKTAADNQFDAGAIDYLDWVMVVGQYMSIESEYLDAVNAYNSTIIQMQYLMGQ